MPYAQASTGQRSGIRAGQLFVAILHRMEPAAAEHPAGKKPAASFKARGNTAFSAGDFSHAIELYTAGINDGTVSELHILFSNRAACFCKIADKIAKQVRKESARGQFDTSSLLDRADYRQLLTEALEDARSCTDSAPSFRRGWVRLASVHSLLGNYHESAEAVLPAVRIDLASTEEGKEQAAAGRDVVDAICTVLVKLAQQQLPKPEAEAGPCGGAVVDGDSDEFSCPQCLSMVFKPVTLADGKTLCNPCVGKYRRSRPDPPAAELARHELGSPSRRRDCHFTDTPFSSMLKHLRTKGREGCSRITVSPTARFDARQLQPVWRPAKCVGPKYCSRLSSWRGGFCCFSPGWQRAFSAEAVHRSGGRVLVCLTVAVVISSSRVVVVSSSRFDGDLE